MVVSVDIRVSDDIEFPPFDARNGEHADPLLADLVHLADTQDVEHGITLTIAGTLLTATLISGYRFYKFHVETAAKGQVTGAESEAALAYKKHMVEFYLARVRLYEPARIAAAESRYRPLYIHLHNARWIGNDGMFTGEAPFWRGRISEVSGFAIRQV